MVVTGLATRSSTPSPPLPSSLAYFFCLFVFFAPLLCSGQLFLNVTIIQLLVNQFRLRIFLAIHVAFHLGQEVSYSFSFHKVPHLQHRKKQQHNSFFKILYCIFFRTVLQVEYRISKSLTGLFFGVVRDQTRSISKGNQHLCTYSKLFLNHLDLHQGFESEKNRQKLFRSSRVGSICLNKMQAILRRKLYSTVYMK